MKILITTSPGAMIGGRNRPNMQAERVAASLQASLPELLVDIAKSSPLQVTVDLGQFDVPGDPHIWIQVTDVPDSVHKVPVMPYDRVWHLIIDWFNENGLLFPSNFRYDTGEHGMSSAGKSYLSW